MLGLLEAEGHPVQDPQLRVRGLDEGVGEAMTHGRLDPREVLADPPAEFPGGAVLRAPSHRGNVPRSSSPRPSRPLSAHVHTTGRLWRATWRIQLALHPSSRPTPSAWSMSPG